MATIQFRDYPLGIIEGEIPQAPIAEKNSPDLNERDSYLNKLKGVQLNQAQIEAVRHFKGPLLTIAGAGSGKTSVLVYRTGYLINVHRISPQNILLMTFTKKAADEMKERLAHLPGITKSMASRVQTSTFHSFYLTILRSRGFNQKILSNERYKQIIIKTILRQEELEDSYEPETLLDLFSSWKMNMVNPFVENVKEAVGEKVIKVFQKYEKWKEENHQIDFDDILTLSYDLLMGSPELLEALQNRFQFIMVDEFQDTNLLQYELIKKISTKNSNLMVVGDDDQTIYSFNGARNDLILNFHREFPSTKEVILNINYRSQAAIVGLGNQIIRHNRKRKPKSLIATFPSGQNPQYSRPKNVDEEAEAVVEKIKDLVHQGKYNYHDIAILYRASSNSRAIMEQVMLDGLPFIHYSQGNQLFYDQWVVKPVVDYLRVSLNPQNMTAVEGIIPTLFIKKEVGIGYISINNQLQPKEHPLIHLTELPSLKEFQKKNIRERIELIKGLTKLTPLTAIKKIRKQFYDKFTESIEGNTLTVDKETIKEMLDELETSAKRFETIAEFLNFIDEMKKIQEEAKNGSDLTKDRLQIMTIHKAKGLEFPVVFLIGASEGILPHVTALEIDKIEKIGKSDQTFSKFEAIEEERRLAYVAVTRARFELYISSPGNYRGKESKVSRFFLEAFGYKEQKIQVQVHPERGKEPQTTPKRPKRKISLLAWICSNESCIAWQRIKGNEESSLHEKECPICKSKMEKGEKIVVR